MFRQTIRLESMHETPAPVADQEEDEAADLPMQQVDPTPEVSEEEEETEEETPFVQRLEQSIGKFIIGLTGDLENTEFDALTEEDQAEVKSNLDHSNDPTERTQRIFVRTLNVLVNPEHGPHIGSDFTSSTTSTVPANNPPPTSAGSSVEGVSSALLVHRKLPSRCVYPPAFHLPLSFRSADPVTVHAQFLPQLTSSDGAVTKARSWQARIRTQCVLRTVWDLIRMI